jgi:DNA-binding response OmpR family regulator
MNVTDSEDIVSAMLVGDYGSERLLVKEVFQRAGWRLFEVRDRRQALHCLERNPVQVVIAESHPPKWDWKHVLCDLRRRMQPPQLVVTSRAADDSLWAEVLNFGAYDVLARPFAADEVERVVAAARRQFDRQRLELQSAGALCNVA